MSPESPTIRVALFVGEHGLLAPGQRVLVAASGGADSAALALVLHALDQPLELAHVDHGWRGAAASEAERHAVTALADHLGVPAHFVPCDASVARTEDAARQWRYRALAGVLEQTGIDTLATGHHRGDQAETLLVRLLRGSGPWGLAGIPPKRRFHNGRFRVVRPLLDEDPQILRSLVAESGLPWVQDPSNADPTYERVRARVRLASAPSGTIETLAQTASVLRRRVQVRDETLRDELAAGMRVHRFAAAVEVPRALVVDQRGFWMDQLLRVLGQALNAEAHGPWLTRRHVQLAHELARSGGDLDLPRGLHWHVRGKRAWLWHREDPEPQLTLDTQLEACSEFVDVVASRAPEEALLDATYVASPTARLLRADDTFSPFGRGQPRTINVAAWLKQRGIPLTIRQRQWVVEGVHSIAWVVGHRIDRRAALTDASTRFWRVRLRG